MKKKFLIGLLISIVFLYLAFRGVNYRMLWTALTEVNFFYLILFMLAVIVIMWIRAYRWKFMVDPLKKAGIYSLFSSTMIGFMANNVLPVRLGELVRAYSLGTKENISKSASFATIVTERVFDGFTLLFILWLTLFLFPFSHSPENVGELIRKGANFTLAANILVFIILIILELKPDPVLNFFKRLLTLLPRKYAEKAENVLDKFSSGVRIFRDVPRMGWIMLWSLILWVLTGISNYLVFLAFDLHPPLQASLMLMVIVTLGVVIPSSPGFVGTVHFFTVIALSLYGYGRDISVPFSIVLHASQYVPVTLLGLVYLKLEHLSLKSIDKKLRKEG
ncbi:MAG: flippase-like domain-containing protein [candidate division Zixibacteria bacterium]|nr:flippase-like domain-containing protein [candidate division Zixibacteria bacterium]